VVEAKPPETVKALKTSACYRGRGRSQRTVWSGLPFLAGGGVGRGGAACAAVAVVVELTRASA
jgi:hypothetical protein